MRLPIASSSVLLLLLSVSIVIMTMFVSADQSSSSALARIEKSLNTNPKSASMWLNAGATLMKADNIAEKLRSTAQKTSLTEEDSELSPNIKTGNENELPHTITVNNVKFNSERALIKSLTLDKKQSLAWHYLASILIKQTLTTSTSSSQKSRKGSNKKNKKNIFATAKIEDQFYTPLDAIAESIRLDSKTAKTWASSSQLLQQILAGGSDNNNNNNNNLLREKYPHVSTLTVSVASSSDSSSSSSYDAVQLIEKAIQLDKGKNAVFWRIAAEALKFKDEEREELLATSSKSVEQEETNDQIERSSIRFDKMSYDSIQCMEKSLFIQKNDADSWNVLCDLLKPKKLNQHQNNNGKKNSGKFKGRFASIGEEMIERQTCLQKAVEQDPQNSRSWLSLAHEMMENQFSRGMLMGTATAKSSYDQMASVIINGKKYTTLQCLEQGLTQSVKYQHFPDTVRQVFRYACSLLSLSTSHHQSTISLPSEPQLDALQCWDVLLSGKEQDLAGTTAVPSDENDADSWEALGDALLVSPTMKDVFINGENYDALAAFVKAIELRRDNSVTDRVQFKNSASTTSSWIGLGQALAIAERRYKETLTARQRQQERPPSVTVLGDTLTSSLQAYAKAIESSNPSGSSSSTSTSTSIAAWEMLCRDMMSRDLVATIERSSVSIHLDGLDAEPRRIEQQMCFLELFERDPENLFAWTNFRIITEGAVMHIPGNPKSKNKEARDPKNISSNLEFRLLAASRFPKESSIWVSLGKQLVKQELSEAVFSRTRHMPTHKVFIRGVENDIQNNDEAWLSLSSIMTPKQKVNVTGLEDSSVVNLNRIDCVIQALKINKKNAVAWQNLGTYLAETILYNSNDRNFEVSIDTARAKICSNSLSAGVGESIIYDTLSHDETQRLVSNREISSEDERSKDCLIVNAQQALVNATSLDPSLYGAWVNLALILRRKSQELSAEVPLATPEQKKLSLFRNSIGIPRLDTRVNAADCLVRAIELTEGRDAPRRQPNSLVAQLYSVLSEMLSSTNRHVSVHGKTMMAGELSKKAVELRNKKN